MLEPHSQHLNCAFLVLYTTCVVLRADGERAPFEGCEPSGGGVGAGARAVPAAARRDAAQRAPHSRAQELRGAQSQSARRAGHRGRGRRAAGRRTAASRGLPGHPDRSAALTLTTNTDTAELDSIWRAAAALQTLHIWGSLHILVSVHPHSKA